MEAKMSSNSNSIRKSASDILSGPKCYPTGGNDLKIYLFNNAGREVLAILKFNYNWADYKAFQPHNTKEYEFCTTLMTIREDKMISKLESKVLKASVSDPYWNQKEYLNPQQPISSAAGSSNKNRVQSVARACVIFPRVFFL